jgi:hypothetical protein
MGGLTSQTRPNNTPAINRTIHQPHNNAVNVSRRPKSAASASSANNTTAVHRVQRQPQPNTTAVNRTIHQPHNNAVNVSRRPKAASASSANNTTAVHRVQRQPQPNTTANHVVQRHVVQVLHQVVPAPPPTTVRSLPPPPQPQRTRTVSTTAPRTVTAHQHLSILARIVATLLDGPLYLAIGLVCLAMPVLLPLLPLLPLLFIDASPGLLVMGYQLCDVHTQRPVSFFKAFIFQVLVYSMSAMFFITTPFPFGLCDEYGRSPLEALFGLVYMKQVTLVVQ